MRFVCCDLGGTTADWAVYDVSEQNFTFRTTILTLEHEDFYEMLDHFFVSYRNHASSDDVRVDHITLGVAGPTDNERVSPTNIAGWEINTDAVSQFASEHGFECKCTIINDFEALGYGILYLLEQGFEREDFDSIYGRLRTGPARKGIDSGSRSLVCGPGTGLGLACLIEGLTKDGFPYIVSSEGGHHTLAPETLKQFNFLCSSGSFKGKRSYESALSHQGLKSIYNFFRKQDYGAEPNYSINSSQIIDFANSGKDQAATDAIELFAEILANFCGNIALTFNCDKAIFLWGGVLKSFSKDLIQTRFKRYYSDRCGHSDRVSRVPVVLVRNVDVPLLGCVNRSFYEMNGGKSK